MHNNFRQTNGIKSEFLTQALCWEYYNKIKNEVVVHSPKTLILSSKIEKKSRNMVFFSSNLKHNNFRQTNAINMKLFIEALCWDKQIK